MSHRDSRWRKAIPVVLSRLGPVLVVIIWLGGVLFATTHAVVFRPAEPFVYLAGPYLTVGAFLVLKRPRHRIAWLLFSFGAVMASAPLVTEVANLFTLMYPLLTGFLFLFPTGSPPSPRWAPVGWLLVVSWVMLAFSLEAVGLIAIPVAVLAGVSPIWRYRHADRFVQAQLKWMAWVVGFGMLFAIPAALIGVGTAVGIFPEEGARSEMLETVQLASGLGFGAALALGVPFAVVVAVLRYRLFEIDRIVSRTVSYTVVVGVLAVVYAGAALGLGSLVGEGSPLVVAASTLAVAALFNPLHRRVQKAVDRRFDRTRYEAGQVAVELSMRLREAIGVEAILAEVNWALSRTVQPSVSATWIKETR